MFYKDATVVDRLHSSDYIERKKQAQAMLEHCASLDDAGREALKAIIDQRRSSANQLSAYDAAKIAGYLEFYATVYRGMSLVSSHGTLAGTNSVFEDVDDERVQMVFGPSCDVSIGCCGSFGLDLRNWCQRRLKTDTDFVVPAI